VTLGIFAGDSRARFSNPEEVLPFHPQSCDVPTREVLLGEKPYTSRVACLGMKQLHVFVL
jgi:hypothetical protein